MQKILFFFGLLNFGICNTSTGQTKDLDSLIVQVANDSLYFDYQLAILAHQNNIVMGVYDLDKIGEILKANVGFIMCKDTLRSLYTIRGGREYEETECGRLHIFNKLKAKYPEIYNGSGISLKVSEYFLAHSDRFRIEREKSLELFNQRMNDSYKKD